MYAFRARYESLGPRYYYTVQEEADLLVMMTWLRWTSAWLEA